MTGRAIVGIDVPVAEVADEDIAAKCAEGGRRQGHGPGRVQPTLADEPPEQVSVGTEDVNESVAGARQVVVLVWLLLREGHEQLASNVVDPKRRKASRNTGIGKGLYQAKVAVEDLDRDKPEVARV